MNRRAQPIHRRKRKAETPPSLDGDADSSAGDNKRPKLDEPEGQLLTQTLHLCDFHSLIADDSVTPPPSESGGSDSVEIQIRPHPHHSNLNDMAIRNLATSPLCTVAHLLRYIKLNTPVAAESGCVSLCPCVSMLTTQFANPAGISGDWNFNLQVQFGDEFTHLSSSTSLKQISRMVCCLHVTTCHMSQHVTALPAHVQHTCRVAEL